MEKVFNAIAWIFIAGDMIWLTIFSVGFGICLIATILKGLWYVIRFVADMIKSYYESRK